MKNKLIYLIALIILTPACWLTATIFWGSMNLGESIVLMIVVALIVATLASVTRKLSYKIWVYVGFLILTGLFLPASSFVKIFPIRDAQPFESPMAFTLLLTLSFALVVAALLLNSSLHLYNEKRNSGVVEGGEFQKQPKNNDWAVVVLLALSILLLAKALHNFYWFMIWDTTYDSLGIIWLPIPVLAVLVSSFMLFIALPGRTKLAGLLYLLLIPTLIAVSAHAQNVDFRQLTDERAEHVSQAIETYFARVGRYPEDLRELTPWYIFPFPGPVIIYGEEWCYDGGEDHYRLGYVYRQHWSDPRLKGRIYKEKGGAPDLHHTCEEEVAALQKRYPDYPYEFWMEGE